MKKLLITGASGFLGYHLLRMAYPDWEVFGIYHSTHTAYSNAIMLSCDITDYIALGNLLEDIEPDAVIHAAALADTAACKTNPDLSYATNIDASVNLAGICADYNIPLAFTSTDLVFDGQKGTYAEDDVKNPLSVYGTHKSKAEEEVLSIYPKATVFRLPLMFGEPASSGGNYIQKLLDQISNNQKIVLFQDEYRSVVGARSVATGILNLLQHTSGVIHLAGAKKISRYEFGLLASHAFGLDKANITPGFQRDIQFSEPRPADVSLNISKAVNLGYAPLSVEEELQLIASKNYLP